MLCSHINPCRDDVDVLNISVISLRSMFCKFVAVLVRNGRKFFFLILDDIICLNDLPCCSSRILDFSNGFSNGHKFFFLIASNGFSNGHKFFFLIALLNFCSGHNFFILLNDIIACRFRLLNHTLYQINCHSRVLNSFPHPQQFLVCGCYQFSGQHFHALKIISFTLFLHSRLILSQP